MTRPACSYCNDAGWVEEPYYSDFEPTTKPAPCPECNSVEHHEGSGVSCLVMILAGVAFVFLMWGVR